MHASVQGSVSFTGHAKSAVTQIYSHYTEKDGLDGHQVVCVMPSVTLCG